MPLPNAFGRRCNTCGVWVPPNAGKTEVLKVEGVTVWPVWCKDHPTAREQEIARQQVLATQEPTLAAMPPG